MDWSEKIYISKLLDKLVNEGYDAETAREIVKRCKHLKDAKFTYTSLSKKTNDSITGETKYGEITVEDKRERIEKKELGNIPERIGKYKLKVTKQHIEFFYFEKSDLETEGLSERPSIYHLYFNEEEDRPYEFGIESREKSSTIISFFCDIISFIIWLINFGYLKKIKIQIKNVYIESLIPKNNKKKYFIGREIEQKIFK